MEEVEAAPRDDHCRASPTLIPRGHTPLNGLQYGDDRKEGR